MAFYTYILRCADGSYYTGHTEDMEARLAAHQAGFFRCYTTSRRPVELVYCEGFGTREEALGNERRVKGWSRAKAEAMAHPSRASGRAAETASLASNERTGWKAGASANAGPPFQSLMASG